MAEKQKETKLGEILSTKELEKQLQIGHLLDRAIALQAKLSEVKELYKEMDEVTELLLKADFKTSVHNGQTIFMVDNYKDKNCVFRAHGIRRFELKIE